MADTTENLYRVANETITLTSLLMLAGAIRKRRPTSRTFTTEWSDQGPHLCVKPIDGDEDARELTWAANLDEDTRNVWEFYADPETTGKTYVFSIDRILAEIPDALRAV